MDLEQLARRQCGVVSRAQALGAVTKESLRWKLAHGVWQRVHPGVYALHSQPLDWHAWAHAALLCYGERAALSLGSAAYVLGIEPKAPPLVHVDVPIEIQRKKRPLVRVRRRRRLETVLRRGMRVTAPAYTVIDLADLADASREDAIAIAARAVQRRKVTVDQLRIELGQRHKHRHRRALELTLGIVAQGAESVLEVDFVLRVLRAHGLPEMRVAVPDRLGPFSIRRDFVDDTHRVVVELDGRVAHEGRRSADMRRDRSAAAGVLVTLRAEWVDVYFEECQLAADIFATQRSRGYRGDFVACGPKCRAAAHLRRSA